MHVGHRSKAVVVRPTAGTPGSWFYSVPITKLHKDATHQNKTASFHIISNSLGTKIFLQFEAVNVMPNKTDQFKQ